MKIFNFNNPRHLEILREELDRVSLILNESTGYSADEIWKNMNETERGLVLLNAGLNSPEPYNTESEWDNIPADLQDRLDISDYELAKYDMNSRVYLRGIETMKKRDPKTQQVIDTFLKKVNRPDVNSLTGKQAMQLNIAIQRVLMTDDPLYGPRNYGGQAMQDFMDRERASGRKTGLE
jgi:hypothetical protein